MIVDNNCLYLVRELKLYNIGIISCTFYVINLPINYYSENHAHVTYYKI